MNFIIKIYKLLWILILTSSIWFFSPLLPVFAETIKSPQTCRIGIYLTSLRDFNMAGKSFTADFRIWSVCPQESLKPLDSMEIVNDRKSDRNFGNIQKRNNQSGNFLPKENVYWSQQEISTTLYYSWDVSNYPFDRHVLQIPLEEVIKDSSQFTYSPDFENSGYKSDMSLGGWEIKDFKITESKVPYITTFGDPQTTSTQRSTRSRLTISISIQRENILNFFKLTVGVYAAFATAMLSFFYDSGQTSLMGARTSLIIGSLFATLVNMRAVEAALGSSDKLMLVDFIHITSIIYIFAAAGLTVYSRLLSETKLEKTAIRLDRTVFFQLFTISFLVFNAVIICHAAIVG